MQAIDLALQQILKKTPPLRGNKIHIITDCQSALQSAVKGDKTKNFGLVISSINTSVKELHDRQITVKIYWTAGHVSLEGNDLADRLANEAAAEGLTKTDCDTYIPLTEIKNLFCKTQLNGKRDETPDQMPDTHTKVLKVYVKEKQRQNS